MTSKLRRVLCALCAVLMLTFVAMGYAALSTELSIVGTAQASPPPKEGIYIESVSVVDSNYLTNTLSEHIYPTNLKTDLKVPRSGSDVTYKITVYNESDVTYWYLGILQDINYGHNDRINQNGGIFLTTKDHTTDTAITFNTADWVPPRTRRDFYVTYRFGANALGESIQNLVNFHFGLLMDSVKDEFLKILNDKVSENGYHYLAGAFNEQYAQNGSDVLGNVGDDRTIFDNLFGPNITVNVNGVATPVTIMVQRKNVDGNSSSGDQFSGSGAPAGCEYTVYITTDGLDGESATVHAVSYTCGPDGVWYQLGQLYEGVCATAPYDGQGTDGFDVESWDATPNNYEVTRDIHYNVGLEQGDQFDKLDSIAELMSTTDQDFYNDVNNNSEKLLKPVCQILYTYRHENGQWLESDNEANKFKPGYDNLLHAFAEIKPYCYIGNGAQEVKIQNASSIPRARLIPILEAIQMAYDYFLSVN